MHELINNISVTITIELTLSLASTSSAFAIKASVLETGVGSGVLQYSQEYHSKWTVEVVRQSHYFVEAL